MESEIKRAPCVEANNKIRRNGGSYLFIPAIHKAVLIFRLLFGLFARSVPAHFLNGKGGSRKSSHLFSRSRQSNVVRLFDDECNLGFGFSFRENTMFPLLHL